MIKHSVLLMTPPKLFLSPSVLSASMIDSISLIGRMIDSMILGSMDYSSNRMHPILLLLLL